MEKELKNYIESDNIKFYLYGIMLILSATIIQFTENILSVSIALGTLITVTFLLIDKKKESCLKMKIFFGYISLIFFILSFFIGMVLLVPETNINTFTEEEIYLFKNIIKFTLVINLLTIIGVFLKKDLIIFNRLLNVVLLALLSLLVIKLYNYKEIGDIFVGHFNSIGMELKNKDSINNFTNFHSLKIIEILNILFFSFFIVIALISSICIFIKSIPEKMVRFFKLTNIIIYFNLAIEIVKLYYSNFEMIYLDKLNIDLLIFSIRNSYLFIILIIIFNNEKIINFLKYNNKNIIIKSFLIFFTISLLAIILNNILNLGQYISYIIIIAFIISTLSLNEKNKVVFFSLIALYSLNLSMILFMIFKNVDYNYIEPLIFYSLILLPLILPRAFSHFKRK